MIHQEINTKWDIRFLRLAREISTWSKDPSTKCGAVIVDNKKRVISVGYNGYPMGIADDASLFNREEKYPKIIHAETNCILFSNIDITGFTIYVYPFMPCSRCAGLIVQSGLGRVVTLHESEELATRWALDMRLSSDMLMQAGITLTKYPNTIYS
jgi:dCMP deaminase